MIAKNKESIIEKTILSARGFYDQLFVLDLGSTDLTVDVVRRNGGGIEQYPWPDQSSEALNYAVAHSICDWTMVLTPGEVVISKPEIFRETLRTVESDPMVGALSVQISHSGPKKKAHSVRVIKRGKGQFQGTPAEVVVDGTTEKIPLEIQVP